VPVQGAVEFLMRQIKEADGVFITGVMEKCVGGEWVTLSNGWARVYVCATTRASTLKQIGRKLTRKLGFEVSARGNRGWFEACADPRMAANAMAHGGRLPNGK
jgi:hypothetical protein